MFRAENQRKISQTDRQRQRQREPLFKERRGIGTKPIQNPLFSHYTCNCRTSHFTITSNHRILSL